MAAELLRPILTVDVVMLTLKGSELHVVLQKRDRKPHAGHVTLIGGYMCPKQDRSTLGRRRGSCAASAASAYGCLSNS